MSEFYEWTNIVLFFGLILATIIFGILNQKHLIKIFHQTDSRNTIELRPIVIFDYQIMGYFSPVGERINAKDIQLYYNRYRPASLQVEMIFNVKNTGKMVAQNLRADWKLKEIKHMLIDPIKTCMDLVPTDCQEFTIKFILHELKNFTIDIDLYWDYGNKKMGNHNQVIRVFPTKNEIDYLTKTTKLDFKKI